MTYTSPFNWRSAPSESGRELMRGISSKATATKRVDDARDAGKDYSTIHGLSMKASILQARHGGAYMRAVPSKSEVTP